jgi:hypothetical protein
LTEQHLYGVLLKSTGGNKNELWTGLKESEKKTESLWMDGIRFSREDVPRSLSKIMVLEHH